MRIYCDIDDVLSETATVLCRLAERMFGKGVDYERVRDFDLQKVFALTDEEMARFSVESHAYENLLAYGEVPGAISAVKTLAREGHAVELVTGRPATSWRGTEAWLKKVGLDDIPVLYVDKYNRPATNDPEAPRRLALEEFLARSYDVAIDDSPLALKLLERWTSTNVLVFDRPWNRAYPLAANMRRVTNWREILDVLKLGKET